MSSILKIRNAWLPAIFGLLLTISGSARAQEPAKFEKLEEAMKVMADEIARYLLRQADAQNSVSIGTFTGPSGSTGGSRIVQSLKNHLAKDGRVQVIDGRGYQVTGKYMGDVEDRGDGRFEMVISATIQDRKGRELQDFRERVTVTSVEDAMAIMGLTVDLPAKENGKPLTIADAKPTKESKEAPKSPAEVAQQDPKKVGDALAASFDTPGVHVEEDRIARASSGSPYGIEIVLKTPNGYQTCVIDPSHSATGTAKVNIDVKQIFAVRIYNATKHNVGCALTIDGINIFAFSHNPHWKELGKMVICPGKSLIKGWHHDGDISHEFLVTNYGDSAAARFGAVDGLGTVTATFFEIADYGAHKSAGAAGFGEKVVQPYTAMPASFGNPVATVSVQYTRPSHPVDLPPQ